MANQPSLMPSAMAGIDWGMLREGKRRAWRAE
jgi:hypothetical protein